MALFKRKKKIDSNLPAEVQAYAQAEHRERMGMAWLVGIVSLLVTVALILALFFGGRWVYRKIAGTDKKQTTDTSQNDKKDDADNPKKPESSETEKPKDNSSTTTPAPQPTAPTTPQPTTTPSTGNTLPNTGPDMDL